jgi:hypothetical protein
MDALAGAPKERIENIIPKNSRLSDDDVAFRLSY